MPLEEKAILGFLCGVLLWGGSSWGLPPRKNCRLPLNYVERQEGTPHRLLHAIALGESGRKTETGTEPWPWTVNAQGEGKFFPTKEAAVSYVKSLQSKGVKSIDVGCMQVNLYFHPNAFESIEDAFEPEINIRYAAKFLKQLNLEQKSWNQAIAHYHSAREDLHTPYRDRVVKLWRQVQRFGFDGDLSEGQGRSDTVTMPAVFYSRFKGSHPHHSLFSSHMPSDSQASAQKQKAATKPSSQKAPGEPPKDLTFFSLKKQAAGPSQQIRTKPVPLSMPARFLQNQGQRQITKAVVQGGKKGGLQTSLQKPL